MHAAACMAHVHPFLLARLPPPADPCPCDVGQSKPRKQKGSNMKNPVTLLTLVALFLTVGLPIATVRTQAEPPEQPGKAVQTFHGNVDAVDTAAKTLTVGGQVIYVAESTKISKQGKMIQLSEIQAGERVNGTARMTFDGKTEALTILVASANKE
jgi:hypothetical protein